MTDNHYMNPDIEVCGEVKVGKATLTEGSQFRIKRDRLKYTFLCLATNTSTGSSWIDAVAEAGGFKSVRVDDIIIPKEKKRRGKRNKKT